MSVTVHRDAVELHDAAMILIDAMLVLRDANQHKPETATAVWLVLETPDGALCWELGEWADGNGMRSAGWYLVGADTPLTDAYYIVRHWCHEPTIPECIQSKVAT